VCEVRGRVRRVPQRPQVKPQVLPGVFTSGAVEAEPVYGRRLRGDEARVIRCDRCPADATTEVVCWYGCTHQQCDECAAQTAKEAAEQ